MLCIRPCEKFYDQARGDDTRPFMLTVSLTQPHDPYVTTQDFWDLYTDAEIDAPRVPPIPVEDRDPHSQSVYYHYSQHRCDLSDQDYRNARRGYYGMISQIDAHLGEVMEALRNTGYEKNTVIIFTSDHGDMIGERGMWFKKTLYDPAIQVPLIIAKPKQHPERKVAPVSLLDLCPTLIDIAKIPASEIRSPMDGKSLYDQERSGPVFVEHLDGGTSAPRVCIRDGDWKLVMSHAYPPTLHNLADDPLELQNLAGTGIDAEAALIEIAAAQWSLDKLQSDMLASQTHRKLVDSALAIGRKEHWDFVPNGATSGSSYVRRGDTFPDVERAGYLTYRRSGVRSAS